MRALSRALAVFVGIGVALAGLPARAAQEPSGKALAVDPEAATVRSGESRLLEAEQPVYMGDRVRTGAAGKAQLEFSDDTRLVVGPSSNLLIERYLLKSSNRVSSFAVTALRGTFRFITGDSPKPAYAIKTPSATIGVRGTEFDVTVQRDGSTEVVLLSGAATICGRGGCIDVSDRCSLIRISKGGSPSLTSGPQKAQRIEAAFPFVNNQSALKPAFQAATVGCANQFQTPAGRAALDPPRAQPAPARVTPPAAPSPAPAPAPGCGPGGGGGKGRT